MTVSAPQRLNEKYLAGLFTHMCKDLNRLCHEDGWFASLNKARLLRTLLFDDIDRNGGIKDEEKNPRYVPVAELMARYYGYTLLFSHGDRELGRVDYSGTILGVIMKRSFSVHQVIDLMANKLGGVHIDPVFSWEVRKNGRPSLGEKERFERIEAAFSLRVGGQAALSYFTDQIASTSLEALADLYAKTVSDFD